MENYKLVLPEHLNHYGFLFGGHLLKWVDECAWIAVSMEYPGNNFVTVAMDDVVFKKSVRQGSILKFRLEKSKEGKTSVQYAVKVFCSKERDCADNLIFSTHVTFVNVGQNGQKIPLNYS